MTTTPPAERLRFSCGFPPSLDTPDHIALAESLGYTRAWCYDSPSFYSDTWMILGLAAARTNRIGLGTAVLVPSLREIMTTASAIATLEGLAPGRVAITVGTGLSGRIVLGKAPMRWDDVADYVRALRSLLTGADTVYQGSTLRMLHGARFTAPALDRIPLLIAADGPKGRAVATDLGDGTFMMRPPEQPLGEELPPWRATFVLGTVLEPGEASSSPRARAATAASTAANYHLLYQTAGHAVDRLPGGRRWRESVESTPAPTRHLEVHAGHLVVPNRHDLLVLDEAQTSNESPLPVVALTPQMWRARLTALADTGITEVAYQPMGPDIERELTAFAQVAGLAG
jgi:5,10-methylenetetrahydromethanopterin reductase